jgi:hypothetical protein
MQRGFNIGTQGECVRQRNRVLRRLGDSGPDVRACDEGGVADERDPTRAHPWHLDIVDRLQERPLRERKDVPELRRQHCPGGCVKFRDRRAGNQRRRDRQLVTLPANVGQKSRKRDFVCRPVPDDVVAPVAWPQVITRTGHGVAEHLLAQRQAEPHGGEQFAMQ